MSYFHFNNAPSSELLPETPFPFVWGFVQKGFDEPLVATQLICVGLLPYSGFKYVTRPVSQDDLWAHNRGEAHIEWEESRCEPYFADTAKELILGHIERLRREVEAHEASCVERSVELLNTHIGAEGVDSITWIRGYRAASKAGLPEAKQEAIRHGVLSAEMGVAGPLETDQRIPEDAGRSMTEFSEQVTYDALHLLQKHSKTFAKFLNSGSPDVDDELRNAYRNGVYAPAIKLQAALGEEAIRRGEERYRQFEMELGAS